MKKNKLILTIITLFLFANCSFGQSQPPNGNFETWTSTNKAEQWTSSVNFLSEINFMTQSVTFYEGTFAAKIETQNFMGTYVIPGICTYGDINVDIANQNAVVEGGKAFTERPTAFKGWYQYTPVNLDTMMIYCILTKYNSLSNSRDTIGEAVFFNHNEITSYTMFDAPFVYRNSSAPDTMNIIIMSSLFAASAGSYMIVDDLSFVYNTDTLFYSVINGNGNLSATANGTPISSGAAVPAGQNVVFTATPNSGYVVREWKHNGVVVAGNTSNTYAINNIQSSATVTVEYRLQNSSLLTFGVEGSNGTLSANVDGANVTTNSYIQNGKNIVFTASPASGYRVKNWKLNGSIVSGNTSNTYVLTNIQQTSDVKVEFEQITYLVTYSVVGTNGSLIASVNGNITASNSQVAINSNIVFIATPSSNYQVKEWKLNGAIVSGNTSNTFAITSLQENSNVTVEFISTQATTYPVSFSTVNSFGTLSATVLGNAISTGAQVEQGRDVVFSASPNAGYRVKEWKLNNVVISGNTSNTYTIVNLQQASNVTVEFELIPANSHNVTFSVLGSNGNIAATVDGGTISSGTAVEQGKNVVFTATPNAHYRVKEWKLNNVVVSGNTSNSFTINNLQAASNVTVEFEAINYTVTYSVIGANGTLAATANSANVASGSQVQEGTEIVFTATPSNGYRVKQWKLNNVVVSGNTSNNYILTLTQTSNVTVEFELIPANSHIVTYSVINGNGTLSASVDGVNFSSGYAVEQGKNVVFTATPAIGYKVKEWKLNSNIVSGNITNTFTTNNIQQAINVTVEFELDDILVTYSVVGSNGALSASVEGVTINSGAMVSPNKTVVFTATPNVGYQVKEWKLNNVVVSGNTSNTFVIPTLQQTANVTVEFEAIASSTYSVVYYVVGGNGNLTASVDGAQIASGTNVQANKTVVFAAAPNSGYVVKEWTQNSNIIAGNTSNVFTIVSLQEVSVVMVEFKPDNVGISDNDKTSINIYPNPSSGIFNILSDTQYLMEVMDIQGRVVVRQQLESGLNELDMSIHQAGVYFVKLSNSDGMHVLKINKMVK